MVPIQSKYFPNSDSKSTEVDMIIQLFAITYDIHYDTAKAMYDIYSSNPLDPNNFPNKIHEIFNKEL